MTRLMLPGLSDPVQAARWAEVRRPGDRSGWEQLADLFTRRRTWPRRFDVIADCGRLSTGVPAGCRAGRRRRGAAGLRPTLPSMRAAAVALAALRGDGRPPVGLVTVGDGAYGGKEIATRARASTVVAAMPDDPRTADVLSNGGEPPPRPAAAQRGPRRADDLAAGRRRPGCVRRPSRPVRPP